MARQQLRSWAVTAPCTHMDETEALAYQPKILRWLKANCTKFGFSLERGDEKDGLHFQVMFQLFKKTDMHVWRKKWLDSGCLMPGHIAPMATTNQERFAYAIKDGSVAGPWTIDSDEEEEVPDDIKEVKKLRPWQAELAAWMLAQGYESRLVWVLIDLAGGLGKSTLSRVLALKYKKEVLYLPPMSDMKDMNRMVMSLRKPTTKVIIIDVPMGMTDEKQLKKLYTAIETIKDGRAYDDRYKGAQKFFTPPKVLVMTNTMPTLSWMAADRWVLCSVDEKNQLKKKQPHKRKEYVDFEEETKEPVLKRAKADLQQRLRRAPQAGGGGVTSSSGSDDLPDLIDRTQD